MEGLPHHVLQLSITSADLELKYATSKHNIELLAKDEEIRKLRAEHFLIEDDAEDLRDQLLHEQESSERIKALVDEHLMRAQDAEIALERAEQAQRQQSTETNRMRTELASLKSSTQTSSALLAEKLALATELSTVRPELEHLRAQASIVEQLRSDKLGLQRQLSEAQCDVESAKAEAKRAQAKRRNTTMEIAQEEQVADLKKELARERRLRKNAEELSASPRTDLTTDDIRRQLAQEKNAREKLEQEVEDLRSNTQLEDVRRELLKAKKNNHRLQEQLDDVEAAKTAEGRHHSSASQQDSDSAAQLELSKEREAREKSEAAAKVREERLEAEKAHLEDKLNQFRSKLREKKEELKVTKAELATMKETAEASAKAVADLEPVKALIKKTVAKKPTVNVADETTLGTPGDGPQAKRRQHTAAVGEKSTFSMTPFLNKTAAPDTIIDFDIATAADVSPITNKRPKAMPLVPAASIKSNQLPVQMAGATKLAVVEEAPEPASQRAATPEDVENVPPVNDADGNKAAPARPKQKPRKSLGDFKSFQTEEAPVKQKRRKLGLAPTLFDEDDAVEAEPGSTSLFGATAYAKLSTVKKGAGKTALGRSALLSTTEASGFQFSPLKRTRRNLDDTLRG